ncbi:hypothetical protein GGS24DRAFT_500605 [Hypoxylon argillaceum]|nr:hypothetical protein GGS24DRAFT_500605 [Hypoxylon argillaceum]
MPALQAAAAPNLQTAWDRHQPQFHIPASQPQRDVSSLHPVFFTGRLRRSPSILPTGPPAAAASSLLHPVAHGYVYRDERLFSLCPVVPAQTHDDP